MPFKVRAGNYIDERAEFDKMKIATAGMLLLHDLKQMCFVLSTTDYFQNEISSNCF